MTKINVLFDYWQIDQLYQIYDYDVNCLGDNTIQNLCLKWTQHHIIQHGSIENIPNGLHIPNYIC
jgi:hypothetical protein